MSHVHELLHDWFLGVLEDDQAREVDAHLADCHDCQAALDQHVRIMTAASDVVASPPVAPLLERATTLQRFVRFTDAIAQLGDVAKEVAEDWLSRIDDAATWAETAMGELQLFHIEGGPAVEDAIFGFVKLGPGASFPEHTHLGVERIFVIQGKLIDEDGGVHGPGVLVERDEGTTHEIRAAEGVPLVYLNIVHTGLDIFGMQFGPDSPEF